MKTLSKCDGEERCDSTALRRPSKRGLQCSGQPLLNNGEDGDEHKGCRSYDTRGQQCRLSGLSRLGGLKEVEDEMMDGKRVRGGKSRGSETLTYISIMQRDTSLCHFPSSIFPLVTTSRLTN